MSEHHYALIVDATKISKELIMTSVITPLEKQHQVFAKIALGSSVSELKMLYLSHEIAKETLVIREKFELKDKILIHNNLGLYEFMHHIPLSMTNLVNGYRINYHLDQLTYEDLETVKILLENNLNISETARNLFIHRNTLIYRLDRIKQITQIDLRKFDDAMLFAWLLLIQKHFNLHQ